MADAQDLDSCPIMAVQVQVLSSAPDNDNPNPVPTGDDFGFLVYLLERKEKWWYRGDTAIFAFENNFNR